MENIITYVNTLFFIYLFANPGTRNFIITNLKIIGYFLSKEIDDGFRRQDEFFEFLFTNGELNTLVLEEQAAAVEQVLEEQVAVEQVLEEQVAAVVVKFEDKYLQKFKAFKNEYSFTTDELQIEQQKYTELKTEFIKNNTKETEDLTWKITKLQRIFNCVTFDEHGTMTDVSEEGNRLLTRYYDIEEEYEDNPDLYMLSDLFAELKEIMEETQQKLKEQDEKVISDDEFKAKAHEHIVNLKLDGYINNYINEMTPLGNVYMRYNNSKKSFEYYSNNTIPYRYLEPVGRKYVITYFCKPLFIDIEDELSKAKVKRDDKKEQDTKDQSLREKNANLQEKKNDVFAKLKSYNSSTNNNNEMSRMGKQNALPPQIKANLPNVNTTTRPDEMLLKESANRYTWEGRLSNMSLLKKVDRKAVDKKYAMSFADFKRLRHQF
jgi:hypothetical protein